MFRRVLALWLLLCLGGCSLLPAMSPTPEQLARMVRFRDVKRKVPVSVRLDPDVLEWLRAKGEGHLTRINDILTNLMEAERRAGSGK